MDLTWSIRGAEGLSNLNSFNDFWILGIYCSYSHGFKNLQNAIEMALKSLFLPQNYKGFAGGSLTAAGGSAPLCDTVELHQFVQHGA